VPQETVFVGRRSELERLAQRLGDVRNGLAKTVLIGGEAGIGKSRLLSTFAESARGAGAHVLSGACEEYFGSPLPYGALIEALEGFRREYADGERAATLGGSAYLSLMRLFELTGDAMTSPHQVFLAVRRMLDRIGEDAPTVLILEDLHWADRSTLDLVHHLAQARPDERRLLLVGSYRSADLNRGDPLWQLLASSAILRRTERLELGAFTRPELGEFLLATRGEPVDQRLIERWFEWSDGIPFYAEQLMVAGALEDTETVRLPADTRTVVLSRLGGLSVEAMKVLRVAAVAGRRMSRQLLRTVSKLPSDVLSDALQECFDRQMLVADESEDVYRFRHALLRETVYQTTVRDMQVDLHVAMAHALAADSRLCVTEGTATAEQAGHWYQAGDRPQALVAAVRAGEDAVRTLAFPSAEVQFTRALTLWPRVEDAEERAGVSRVRVLAWAADAARWSGHVMKAVDYARQAIGELDSTADPGRAGELHERLGSYLWEAGLRADSVAAYQQASSLLREQPASAVKARVLAGLALAELQAGRDPGTCRRRSAARRRSRRRSPTGRRPRSCARPRGSRCARGRWSSWKGSTLRDCWSWGSRSRSRRSSISRSTC
jgi:hypothetical protein